MQGKSEGEGLIASIIFLSYTISKLSIEGVNAFSSKSIISPWVS